MPLNMNTVGTGTGIGVGAGGSGVMGPLDISTKFRRNADEISLTKLSSFDDYEYTSGDGTSTSFCSMPSIYYKHLWWFVNASTSSSSTTVIGYYDVNITDDSDSSSVTQTLVPTALKSVLTWFLVDDTIWIIGTTTKKYDPGTGKYNNADLELFRFDGTTLTQMSSHLMYNLLKNIKYNSESDVSSDTEKRSMLIHPLMTINGDYPTKIILTQVYSTYIYWHFCELLPSGFTIHQSAYAGSTNATQSSSSSFYIYKNTYGTQDEPYAFFAYDDFYHGYSMTLSNYANGGTSYGSVYNCYITFKEYSITLKDNKEGYSYNNPSLVFTEKVVSTPFDSLTIGNGENNGRAIYWRNTYFCPLTIVSKTKFLLSLIGNKYDTNYIGVDPYYVRMLFLVEYDGTKLNVTDVTKTIGPSKCIMKFHMYSGTNTQYTLLPEQPYIIEQLPPVSGHISGVFIRRIDATKIITYQDPAYEVQVYLISGDSVMCNAGIQSYMFNNEITQCNNQTIVKIKESGLYTFTTSSYDTLHHPEFLIKSKFGSIGNVEIAIDGNDLIGYFQRGMRINDYQVTTNGYQVIKGVYTNKRIDISL